MRVKEWKNAKINHIYPERGGFELSEYQIRFSVPDTVNPQISIKFDLFLRILADFLTFSVPLGIPINPDFLENTVEVKQSLPLTKCAVTT